MSFKAVSNQTVSQICQECNDTQGAAQNVILHAVLPFYLKKVIFNTNRKWFGMILHLMVA